MGRSLGRRSPGRSLRPFVIALGGVFLLICLGGAAAWYFAASAAEKTLDALIAQERSHGRSWTCPERSISGFPFSLQFNCKELRLSGLISGKPATAQVTNVQAVADLWHPQKVTARIAAPFTLRSQDGRTDLSATWNTLHLELSGFADAAPTVGFGGEGLALKGVVEDLGALAVGAAQFDGVIAPAASGQQRAYDFRVAAHDLANPLLALVFNAQQGDDFNAQGTITEMSFDPSARPAENLERWRASGGRIDFTTLSLSQGQTQISVHGTMMIDPMHRPAGHLDTESSGIEPILRRYGINPSLATAGALLSGLLGGHSSAPAQAKNPAAIRLPVRMESGNLIVGPVQTALRLPALY